MSDIENLADRLDAAASIEGKPHGRHMVEVMSALAAALSDPDRGDDRSRNIADIVGTLTACIANEANLFDDLAAVAREASTALRQRESDMLTLFAALDAAHGLVAISDHRTSDRVLKQVEAALHIVRVSDEGGGND